MISHKQYLDIAEVIAKSSNCVSHQVGCVLVKDGRIISSGYNGTPSGYVNCCDNFPNYNAERDRLIHRSFSNRFEIHAEQNAILWAAKNGMSTDKALCYTTVEPCHQCVKMLIGAGISRIFYRYYYDANDSDRHHIIEFANKLNVQIIIVK